MEMPIIDRCFGMFPPKYACYLISLTGLGCGGFGLAGIILFGLVEEILLTHFIHSTELNPALKKAILLTIGISSLLLVAGGTLLFLGVSASNRSFVVVAKWVLLVMCLLILIGGAGAPLSCFFLEDTCFVKHLSTVGTIFAYTLLTIFVEFWMYFMVVTYNLELEL